MTTKTTITSAKIAAMKSKDSFRSNTIGSILASIKQYEVDNRKEADEAVVISTLNRMLKQRQESIVQFKAANRQDLIDIEENEISVIKEFLPAQVDDAEIERVISSAISTVGSSTSKDIGAIMKIVKSELNGKADMAKVSALVKSKLT